MAINEKIFRNFVEYASSKDSLTVTNEAAFAARNIGCDAIQYYYCTIDEFIKIFKDRKALRASINVS